MECSNCKKILPENYKYKGCEDCRSKWAESKRKLMADPEKRAKRNARDRELTAKRGPTEEEKEARRFASLYRKQQYNAEYMRKKRLDPEFIKKENEYLKKYYERKMKEYENKIEQ